MTRTVVAYPPVEPGPDLRLLLIESVTDYAIFALDPDGRVSTWNLGAERLKGYRADEIVGRHFSCFYATADREAGRPDTDLAITAAEGRWEDEGWRLRKDGSRFWANVVTTALRGVDGRLLGFGKVVRDLTERKQGENALRDGENRFRLLVSSVSDHAIFLLKPDGRVASWNVGAELLKGYRADEIIGEHFSRFYVEEDRRNGVPEQMLQKAIEAGTHESEGWRLRKDGQRFWAHAVLTALYSDDGRHQGFAKVTRDLTDRKRTDDILRGVLDRERAASERLRQLDLLKNELVAVIAHDLRGPVSVAQSFLHLLVADWASTTEAEKLESIDLVSERIETLGALVDDVFDVARIEAGQLEIDQSPVELRTTIARVVTDLAMSDPTRVVNVRVDDVRALGDERRTLQVLTNLMSNACKFSARHLPVELTAERVDDEVIVSVVDHGPGIPVDQQALLFRRFSRLPQSAGTPGSGIGLYIARSLAEAQNGRLWVESVPGSGAAFRFALPLATPDP
jgi:PAS domain S-box-containing protein